MAQLKSYYSLCPLIDHKSLIGISEDSEIGCGIVTLSKNVVTRYKFSDQKQIGCWTSKDRITASVLYDNDAKKYVGVFNEDTIKSWDVNAKTLDGLKKTKFSKHIMRLIKCENGSLNVIFEDGGCSILSHSVRFRKNVEPVALLEKGEVITDAAIYSVNETNYVCYIVKQAENNYCIIVCELSVDVNTLLIETMNRINIKREEWMGGKVTGVTISSDAEPPQVHVMWSDGRLFSFNLMDGTSVLVGHVPWICSQLEVSMSWMGDNHIAIYGADAAQEGAALSIFNALFGVNSCSHPLKLYCNGARMWCLKEYILLESTQHLAVLPYILSSHQDTFSLIGSHKNEKCIDTLMLVDWGQGKAPWKSEENWNELANNGVSEREICLRYLPALLEKNDITQIKNALKDFTDVPENIIVNLITYIIEKCDMESASNITNEEFASAINGKPDLRDLLDFILGLPYIKENMIPYLRKHFEFYNMLFLMRYLNYLLEDTSCNTVFDSNYENKIIVWGSVLVDAHFQHILLSNEINTYNIVSHLKDTIDTLIINCDEIETVLPIVQSLLSGKDSSANVNINDNATYYIEEIKLNCF